MPKGRPYTKEDLERLSKVTSKICTWCWQHKPIDQFGNCATRATGKTDYCKECRRHRDFKEKYGITAEQYDEMYRKQGGVCKICGCVPKGIHNQKILHVDHDKITGKVRGLLCSTCNLSLGGFKHSLYILVKAFNYLEEFEGTDKQTASKVVLLRQKEPINKG